jgi:hypothetical protein
MRVFDSRYMWAGRIGSLRFRWWVSRLASRIGNLHRATGLLDSQRSVSDLAGQTRLREAPALCRFAIYYQRPASAFDQLFCAHAIVAKISLQYLYFSILCYCVSFLFIKVSILAQYRRIFSVDTTTRIINVVMAITISSGIAALFTFIFACVPIDAFWNVIRRSSAKCVDAEMYNRICVFSKDHVLILI